MKTVCFAVVDFDFPKLKKKEKNFIIFFMILFFLFFFEVLFFFCVFFNDLNSKNLLNYFFLFKFFF